jgi:hypothetical protein
MAWLPRIEGYVGHTARTARPLGEKPYRFRLASLYSRDHRASGEGSGRLTVPSLMKCRMWDFKARADFPVTLNHSPLVIAFSPLERSRKPRCPRVRRKTFVIRRGRCPN